MEDALNAVTRARPRSGRLKVVEVLERQCRSARETANLPRRSDKRSRGIERWLIPVAQTAAFGSSAKGLDVRNGCAFLTVCFGTLEWRVSARAVALAKDSKRLELVDNRHLQRPICQPTV